MLICVVFVIVGPGWSAGYNLSHELCFTFASCLYTMDGEQACGVNKQGLEESNWNEIDVDDAVQALVGQAKDVSSNIHDHFTLSLCKWPYAM